MYHSVPGPTGTRAISPNVGCCGRFRTAAPGKNVAACADQALARWFGGI
jgi:hypothetical protein